LNDDLLEVRNTVSKIESRFGAILENYTPPLPKRYDILVRTKHKLPNEELWPYPYYYHQLDAVIWPEIIPSGGTKKLPILPIDIELDDPTHDKKRRVDKDKARDLHLMLSNYWNVIKPPDLVNMNGTKGWIVIRIQYADLETVVTDDYQLKLEYPYKSPKPPKKLDSPAYVKALAKYESKKTAYNLKHQTVYDNINECLKRALYMTNPCRISLVDGEITVTSSGREE
jgi:hypothetical protein